jgi:hypothetical protein
MNLSRFQKVLIFLSLLLILASLYFLISHFTKHNNNDLDNTKCTPSCYGKNCGDSDGCKGSCSDCTICKCPYRQVCKDGKCIDQTQPGKTKCTRSCYGKNCGDSDGCKGACSDCTICKCSDGQVCKDGKCIDQTQPDPTCTPSCYRKNCGDSDGCGGVCSKCSICFCTPTNTCTYGNCNHCRSKSLCNIDGLCGANTDGCGGPCQCPDGSLCNEGHCVPIDKPKNGWNKETIQALADAMYEFMSLSKSKTYNGLPSLSYNYLCVTRKTAFCIANAIASNYQYNPGYVKDINTLPIDSKKYINSCLSNCLGVKGNWSTLFYNEILQKNYLNKDSPASLICFLDKLQDTVSPVDLYQAIYDINQTDDMTKVNAASSRLEDMYKIPHTACYEQSVKT